MPGRGIPLARGRVIAGQVSCVINPPITCWSQHEKSRDPAKGAGQRSQNHGTFWRPAGGVEPFAKVSRAASRDVSSGSSRLNESVDAARPTAHTR